MSKHVRPLRGGRGRARRVAAGVLLAACTMVSAAAVQSASAPSADHQVTAQQDIRMKY